MALNLYETHEALPKVLDSALESDNLSEIEALISEISAVELINAILAFEPQKQYLIIQRRKDAAEILAHLQDRSPAMQSFLPSIEDDQLIEWLQELDSNDAADIMLVLMDLAPDKATKIINCLPEKDQELISGLVKYQEDTAGGIMDAQFVCIEQDQTVEQAIYKIRKFSQKEDITKFYTVYVVDPSFHLIGSISVTQLLLAPRNLQIASLTDPHVISVDVSADQEEVAVLAREYNLVVIPVIDKHLRLVGRITVSDIFDIMQEEHEEDLGRFAGTGSEEVLEHSLVKTIKDRIPWLLLGLFGGVLTAVVMSHYKTKLIQLPQVTLFIPLVAALGGNIAIQSSSIVVRGLATGEIRLSDTYLRLWKELRVGVVNGIICGVLLLIVAWMLIQNIQIALAASLSLLIVVAFAALVGASVPIVLKHMNIDPAVATGPFITTANDVIGVSIYLTISFYAVQFW